MSTKRHTPASPPRAMTTDAPPHEQVGAGDDPGAAGHELQGCAHDAEEDPQPAVSDDAPRDPQPPAEAEVEPERELVEAAGDDTSVLFEAPINTEAVNDPPAPALTADPAALGTAHIAALGDMLANRLGLYAALSATSNTVAGYGASDGSGLHDAATVAGLVDAGLAHYEPSGGRHGSVKVTAEGAVAYRRARQAAPVTAE